MHRMVLVRNVPANATEDQLREHLTKSCHGASVGEVRLQALRARGAIASAAIATLADTNQAERCIREVSGTEMDGWQLQAYPALASSRRARAALARAAGAASGAAARRRPCPPRAALAAERRDHGDDPGSPPGSPLRPGTPEGMPLRLDRDYEKEVLPGAPSGFFWEDEDQVNASTPRNDLMNAEASTFVQPRSASAHGRLSSTAASFVPSSFTSGFSRDNFAELMATPAVGTPAVGASETTTVAGQKAITQLRECCPAELEDRRKGLQQGCAIKPTATARCKGDARHDSAKHVASPNAYRSSRWKPSRISLTAVGNRCGDTQNPSDPWPADHLP